MKKLRKFLELTWLGAELFGQIIPCIIFIALFIALINWMREGRPPQVEEWPDWPWWTGKP